MNKKLAQIIEWIGVAIILSGVGFFAVIYFKKLPLDVFHYSLLLWILGFGILCYVPINFVRMFEKLNEAKDYEEKNLPEAEISKKAATTLKRTVALKIIVAVVLIIYGVLKYIGLR